MQHVFFRVAPGRNWNFSNEHTLNIRTRCVSCVRTFVRACGCVCVLALLKSQLGTTFTSLLAGWLLKRFNTRTHTHTHARTYVRRKSVGFICSYFHESDLILLCIEERWGAGVETQKNVRGEIGGWGRVPFNETYAPSLSTIYDGA